jgi:redox-sensitive bicupin YhaK (pirin superfamily)
MIIEARLRDIGGLTVRRALPSIQARLIGPFIFLDHFGPVTFAPGAGLDVRPHPHVHLATVTYLFAGEIVHRDSLGSHCVIRPGDVNWMHAGRGIVHSERTDEAARHEGTSLHGIQAWVALPRAHEDSAPDFQHWEAGRLPTHQGPGVRLRVVAGTAYGLEAPVTTMSPLFFVDASLAQGCRLEAPGEHDERAAYVAEGSVRYDGERHSAGRLLVFAKDQSAVLEADSEARIVLIGGAPLDGERHIEWNFVSSSRERIEEAKRAWKEGRFPRVPGDEREFIPLPE